MRLNHPPLQLLWQEEEQEQSQLQPPHEHEDEQLQPPQLQLLQLLQLLQPNPKAGVSAPPLRAISRTTLYISLTSNNREPSHTRQRRSDQKHSRHQQETQTVVMGTRPGA